MEDHNTKWIKRNSTLLLKPQGGRGGFSKGARCFGVTDSILHVPSSRLRNYCDGTAVESRTRPGEAKINCDPPFRCCRPTLPLRTHNHRESEVKCLASLSVSFFFCFFSICPYFVRAGLLPCAVTVSISGNQVARKELPPPPLPLPFTGSHFHVCRARLGNFSQCCLRAYSGSARTCFSGRPCWELSSCNCSRSQKNKKTKTKKMKRNTRNSCLAFDEA